MKESRSLLFYESLGRFSESRRPVCLINLLHQFCNFFCFTNLNSFVAHNNIILSKTNIKAFLAGEKKG